MKWNKYLRDPLDFPDPEELKVTKENVVNLEKPVKRVNAVLRVWRETWERKVTEAAPGHPVRREQKDLRVEREGEVK